MSVISENAIVITATMDTSGVTNGVQRIQSSTAGVKAFFEEAAASAAPIFARAGPKAADGFLDGMTGRILKSMAIRDAIRFVLNGLVETFKDVQTGLEDAMGGAAKTTYSIWADAANQIKALFKDFFPGFDSAMKGVVNSRVGAVEASEQQRKELAALKEHPENLKTSPEALTARLDALLESAAKDQENNIRYQSNAAIYGPKFTAAGADLNNEDYASRKKQNSSDQEYIRSLLSIAEENKRKDLEAGKKQQTESFKAANEGVDSNDKLAGDQREEDAKAAAKADSEAKKEAAKAARDKSEADRKAAELSKRKTEMGLSQDEHDLGKAQGGVDRDLNFTEKQLGSQRATSAVSIQGGLYGRNNSAAALVQHAAQQVSLLRSIDANIKELREQHSELTLQ